MPLPDDTYYSLPAWDRLIVEPGWVQANGHRAETTLVDVRAEEEYREAHLPGATWFDVGSITVEVDGVPGLLARPEAFEQAARQAGIASAAPVLVYGDNLGLTAARLVWALRFYGHHAAGLLNGGIDRWLDEGLPVSEAVETRGPGDFRAAPDETHLATLSWIVERAGRADLVLLDTRSEAEYREGHLPGAVRWNWENGLPETGWRTFGDPERIAKSLHRAAVTPDKEVVTYCHSGVRAAHTALLLRGLGYERVRLYDGSWVEWKHCRVEVSS